MVAACPRCAARYRVDPERIGAEGARLRCARCDAVFRVRAPQAHTPPLAAPTRPELPTPVPEAPPVVERPARAAPAPAPRETDVAPPADRTRLVLIADSEVDEGKRTAAAVASWGLQPILVHDGVEAMLTIQRMLPAIVVLDAALPKMFGFQVCEVVKRNEALRDTRVVLIGAIHHRDRYRRQPSELYGADVYIERPDLADRLAATLRSFGLPLRGEAPEPAASVESAPAPPVEAPAPPAQPIAAPPVEPPAAPVRPAPVEPVAPVAAVEPTPAPVDPALADEEAKAARLARIIVSDIVLYNQEEFDAAVAAGNVEQALRDALDEGRQLFAQRVDARVREGRDHLREELLRVAAERAGR